MTAAIIFLSVRTNHTIIQCPTHPLSLLLLIRFAPFIPKSSWRKQKAQRTKWIQKVENNNCVAVAVIWCEFSLLTRWRYTSLKKQQAKATAATVAVVVTATATTNEEQEINFRVLRPSVCVRVHVSTLPRKKLNKTETNDNDGTKCNVDRIHLRMHMAQSYPTTTLTHKHNTQMKVKGIRNRYRICMSNI